MTIYKQMEKWLNIFLEKAFNYFDVIIIAFQRIFSIIINAYWGAKLKFKGKNVIIYRGIIIHSPENVVIGENSRIGDYVQMWGGGGINIGKNVLIAANTVITSQTHDTSAKLYINSQRMKPVHIEENVWIGASVVILPGVTIKKNSIIGAGSVVTYDIPPNSLAVGIPSRVVKTLKR